MGTGNYKALSHKEFLAGQGLRCLVVVMGRKCLCHNRHRKINELHNLWHLLVVYFV